MPKTILHLEGLAVLLVSLYVYDVFGFSWLWFIVGILLPDASMIGYLKGKKLGAIIYNLVHNYLLALGLVALGFLTTNDTSFAVGLILTAHVGMDRLCGFGLKYPTAFKDTHMQRV